MTNTDMETLMLLGNILALMAVEGNPLEIKMDPGMTEGQPSYIYCDVGTVTAGVSLYTEPADLKANCFAPEASCSSSLYTITQNTSGVLLGIASVNVSRDEGEWYCRHDTNRSSNTISLNDHTIAGILLRQDWTEPSGPIDIFSAVMTLSCTNQVPDFSFTFIDSEANTGTVPTEAVSTTAQSSYDGTTCENGNKFYVITLRASNNLDVFNNKTGVKFTFTYYGHINAAPFSVNFLERTSGGLRVWVIVIIVVIVVLVILTVIIIICCLKKKKKCCFHSTSATTTNNGVVNNANGPEHPMSMTPR